MEVSKPLHIFSATMCLGLCTAIALATDNIANVIGVLGGLLATTIMFWFPAFIYWSALWPTQPYYLRYVVIVTLITFGVCGYASVAQKIG